MRDVETTLAEMREFLPVASKDDEQRVRDLTERDIKRTLRDVRIPDVVIGRVLAQWPEFRADDEWVSLLASLVAWVDQCRGDVDVPIPIWDDLDDAGESGRIFYFYLFAICYDLACGFLSDGGCPSTSSIQR